MVFKIGDNDYSAKVLMDTYKVNRIDIYTEWEDANGTTHRSIYRQKVQGEFEMQISKLSEYNAFISDVQAHKLNGGFVPVKLAINNENTENCEVYAFIDYTPIRTMRTNYTKSYLSFTVTIEER